MEWRGMARRTWIIAVVETVVYNCTVAVLGPKMVNYREGKDVSHCRTTEFRIDHPEND